MAMMNIAADLRETVAALQGAFGSGQNRITDKGVLADIAKTFGIH